MAYGCMFANKLVVLTVFCIATIEFSASSPTRRQSSSISETTSAEPAVSTSNDAWGDSDDFDLDGEGWLKQPSASSISPGPNNLGDYDDYDDDDNLVMDGEEDDDDNDDVGGKSEFLFVPPKEERSSRQDDDDDDSHIKVRHTGKYAFSRNMNDDDDDDDDDDPRRIDDEDYEPRLGDQDHSDDHILAVPHRHDVDDDDNNNMDNRIETKRDDEDDDDHIRAVLPKLEVNRDEQEEDDNSVEDEDDNVFETPEEEAADAIYGDRVFLY